MADLQEPAFPRKAKYAVRLLVLSLWRDGPGRKVAESCGIAAFPAPGVPDYGIMPPRPGPESIFRISAGVGLLSALEREPLLLAGFR